MKILDIIDYQHPLERVTLPNVEFALRRLAVRAVVSDSEGRVYLIQATNHGGYYKLPGGGVDPGEDVIEALHREVLEEIGYEVEIGEPVGRILQFEEERGFLQESLCYRATITGGDGVASLTESEARHGMETVTFDSLALAISAVAAYRPNRDRAAAVTRRELRFLQAAR
jgi:8-oxo-dGTP diphosphatase